MYRIFNLVFGVAALTLLASGLAHADKKRVNEPTPHLLITSVNNTCNAEGQQLLIIGGRKLTNGASLTVKLGETPLDVVSATSEEIQAVVPDDFPGNFVIVSDYLLEVTTGNGVKNHDNYDLTYVYTCFGGGGGGDDDEDEDEGEEDDGV